MLIDHENDMHRRGEIDLIPEQGEVKYEYMTDASDFALGIYDCQLHTTMRRQLSVEEGSDLDIAMKEILAIKMLVQNLDISARPQVIRYVVFVQFPFN